MKKPKSERESGELVIEATFVVTISVFMIWVMVMMGMYLYQQAVVQIAAERTAQDIALCYPHLNKEPYYNYTNYYDFMNDHTYRNTLLSSKFISTNEKKATWYAYGLLDMMSLRDDEYRDADVNVEIVADGILGRTIEVEIVEQYEMPISGSLWGLFGIPETIEISASASADVVDMSDKMSTYNFVIVYADKLTNAVIGKFASAAKKWVSFVKDIKNYVTNGYN